MKFLLLGASGSTGSLFIDKALADHHEVVGVVRNRSKLEERLGLSIVVGDVRDADALAAAAQGVHAVVSTLGVGNTRSPNNLILDTTRAIIAAAKRTGFSRVVLQSAFGVGASYDKASWLIRLGYNLAPAVFADKAAGEELLARSDLDWTIAYPGVLTNGTRSGRYSTTELSALHRLSGLPRISRADVAEFLLTCAGSDTWNRRIVVLARN